jgi:hypothetical protein
MTQATAVIPFERIVSAIYVFRGEKVMLDRDLARLYGVPTKVLKQAVKRNASRFPEDFMFLLTPGEFEILRSQFVTSKTETRGGTQYVPMAFTEQGVAMLSSVLNSPRAIEANIAIIRAFVRLREFLLSQAKLAKRLRQLEQEVASHGKAIGTLFDAMQELGTVHSEPIGYQYVGGSQADETSGKTVREARARYRTRSRTQTGRKA